MDRRLIEHDGEPSSGAGSSFIRIGLILLTAGFAFLLYWTVARVNRLRERFAR